MAAPRKPTAGKKLPAGAKRIEDNALPSDGALIAEARKRHEERRRQNRTGETEDVGHKDGPTIQEAADAKGTSDAAVVLGDAKTGDPDVPDELAGLVGDGADANTILERGGAIVETVRKSATKGNFSEGGPEKVGESTSAKPSGKLPEVGTMVSYHSTMRRAGRRDHAPLPAIVTGVDEANGRVSLTVFDIGRVRFVSKIGGDKRNEEHYSLAK